MICDLFTESIAEKIDRFADAARTGINGFFGATWAATAEENRRPV